MSPSNCEDEIEEKSRAHLAAGAQEVWTVAEGGAIRFFGVDGERGAQQLRRCPGFAAADRPP